VRLFHFWPAFLLPVLLTTASGADLPGEGVSRELARERAAVISDVRYALNLTLEKRAPRIKGHATIQFQLAHNLTGPLALDFRDLDTRGVVIDGSARNLKVNGTAATLAQHDGHILLPAASLKAGQNSVELDFDSGVAEASRAITRYVDSQDGSEYLYSLFVPMDASLAFPCFDQPDLKARFTLSVTAPSDWTIVANTPAAKAVATGSTTQTNFAETKPISTYLFAFAAGPFERLEGPTVRGIPLQLFVRKSMVARAREEWPSVQESVRRGIELMSDYFAQPFPFPKYDEVLIPGFPYGGMEHAGATFLNEDTVLFRTVPTVNDRNRREITVIHELAHQWFGDFVTMRWFDDLWLKEGFAQYMAYHTQAQFEPPETVWKRFYESIKPAAYRIDGTRGTTPIYQQIPNLKDAKSAYGAIVYQKAPSLLKLLNFNIGEDHFRDGVRIFLREHAYANAEWKDLIGAFSRASQTDLAPWAKLWVEQRGMPQVEVNWSCSEGKIAAFQITQKDVLNEGHLWPIRTQILLGGSGRVMASLTGATAPVTEAIGKRCPTWVFANEDDNAYGRFLLDAKSQVEVIQELGSIASPFERTLLWGALWDGMREVRVAPEDYVSLAMRLLPEEKDPELALSVNGRLAGTYTTYLGPEARSRMAGAYEALLIRNMKEAPAPDLRISSFRALYNAGTSEKARATVHGLLDGSVTIPGVPLRQRDRWNLIATLVALGDAGAGQLLAVERQRDQTEDGRKYAWVSGAGAPTKESKKEYFASYLTPSGVQEDWITASLPLFNRWDQTSLTLPYLKPALDALPQMKRERKIFFVLNWLASFVEGQDSAEALRIVDSFLAANQSDPDLKLKVLEVRDELARTVKIRERENR
jgi:aminopeptidase N